jgi:hypothetical protein
MENPTSIDNPAKYEILSLFRGSILSYMVGFYIFAFYMELHFRIPALQALRFQFTYGAIVGFCCLLAYLKDVDRSSPLNSVTKVTFWLIAILGIYTVFSMDREESMWVYKDRVTEGFGSCTNTNQCEAACPAGISVTNIHRMNREFLRASLCSAEEGT